MGMTDLFGFNPKDFNDEEIIDRITELSRRIVWASRAGQNAMASQLRMQQLQLEAEQRERMAQPRLQRMMASSPVCVETDPDLAQAAKREIDLANELASPKKTPRSNPFTITRERIKPTKTPTRDD